ncbi:MAG: sugar phosphate isomerase/epimerase family protein [Planctomycetota bacterium]
MAILADLGYDGVALTPDVHHLDPLRSAPDEIDAFRRQLDARGLGVVLETGARFVLDPARKHRPSLLDPPSDAGRRLDFLRRCVDMAARLGAPVVTVWSGTGPEGQTEEQALERLATGLRALCAHATSVGVRIGFEPEPGMAVETATRWPAVRDRVGHEALGLTLDVGHCLATGEGDPADAIRRYGADLLVLQLDDHRPGVHEHLMFGEGDLDFASVGAAVHEIGFRGPLEVELSRHAATAPSTARASLAFLRGVFEPTAG